MFFRKFLVRKKAELNRKKGSTGFATRSRQLGPFPELLTEQTRGEFEILFWSEGDVFAENQIRQKTTLHIVKKNIQQIFDRCRII